MLSGLDAALFVDSSAVHRDLHDRCIVDYQVVIDLLSLLSYPGKFKPNCWKHLHPFSMSSSSRPGEQAFPSWWKAPKHRVSHQLSPNDD